MYLILEYAAKGELYKILRKEGKFSEDRAANYIAQITLALQYLHKRNVIHRDIKPENLLLGLKGEVKIADFGWSVHSPNRCVPTGVQQSRELGRAGTDPSYRPRMLSDVVFQRCLSNDPHSRRTTMCGTLDYLAPEMVEGKAHDNRIDLWSLGILAYEFLVGSPPFETDDQAATCRRIARVDLAIPSDVSPQAADLIQRLLVYTPDQRMPLDQVLRHPWLASHVEAWERTIATTPSPTSTPSVPADKAASA